MTTHGWSSWYWKLELVSALAVGGAIAVCGDYALAQQSNIVPDSTLGNESSVVVPNYLGLPIEAIAGGAERGENLFHSFQKFNVSEGRGAYFFSSSADIQNILARVTGNSRSEILGILGTFGESHPNLFLMNPNGIIFGPYASLDVGGAFVATTANGVMLGNTGLLSASEPETSNLLAVSPSALFFNALANQAEITNRSTATTTALGFSFRDFWTSGSIIPFYTNGLQASDSQSLLLVGGNVRVDGGVLSAPGGRVELGGLAARGIVELNDDSSLSFPDVVAKSDVSLTNGAIVFVAAGGGGSIAINAQEAKLQRASSLIAGIGQGLGSVDSRAGDVEINAGGAITISDSSFVSNGLFGGIGSNGNVKFTGQKVDITNGSIVNTTSIGQGDAGSVSIQASDTISLLGVGTNSSPSGVLSSVASLSGFIGVGNGGDINLQARAILLDDGAQVSTNNFFAQGRAGDIRVDVLDSIFLNGGAGLQTGTAGQGNAGRVTIQADHISLNGLSDYGIPSQITSSVGLPSGLAGSGRGGDININAGFLSVTNGARLMTEVNLGSRGTAGNLNIQTGRLSIRDGSQVSASTFGEGNAGNLLIQASESVELDGGSQLNGLFAQVNPKATGAGGNLTVETRRLSVTDGSKIQVSTFGQGDAGDLLIQADVVDVLETSTANNQLTGMFAEVDGEATGVGGNLTVLTGQLNINGNDTRISTNTFGQGNAGTLTIETDQLSVSNGAQVSASTFGQGDANSLVIRAADSVELSGEGAEFSSGLFAQTNPGSKGAGGNLTIATGQLRVTDGAQVATSTFGAGPAGNLSVRATDSVELSGQGQKPSGLFAQVDLTGTGKGGNLSVETRRLSVSDGGTVQVATFGQGNAGELLIRASEVNVFETSRPNSYFTGIFAGVQLDPNTINPPEGDGGNLTIETERLSIRDGGQVAASTFGQGDAGSLVVRANDLVEVVGTSAESRTRSFLSADVDAGAEGTGGDLTIKTRQLSVRGGARVSVGTFGQGDAGTLQVHATESVQVIGTSVNGQLLSELSAAVGSDATGQGGNLSIETEQLTIQDGAQVTASTASSGQGGNLSVIAPDSVVVSRRGRLSTQATANGNAGNLTINTRQLTVQDRAQISSSTVSGRGGNITLTGLNALQVSNGSQVSTSTATGRAGSLSVNTTDSIELSGQGSGLLARATNGGNAGSLAINTGQLNVLDGAEVTVSSPRGQAGNLTVMTNSLLLDQGNLTAVTAKSQGAGGANITLQVQDLLLVGNESQISANAFREANGGNINIDTEFLVVRSPRGASGSDINANAFQGNGGRLDITAQGIFGIQRREQQTSLNDITASSELGTDGTIELNTPDVELQNSLTQLSANFVSSEQVVAGSCLARRNVERGSFTVTGTGGLPQTPYEALSGRYAVTSVQPLQGSNNASSGATTIEESIFWKPGDPIQEAQGMVITADGRTILRTNAQLVAVAKPQDLVCQPN